MYLKEIIHEKEKKPRHIHEHGQYSLIEFNVICSLSYEPVTRRNFPQILRIMTVEHRW